MIKKILNKILKVFKRFIWLIMIACTSFTVVFVGYGYFKQQSITYKFTIDGYMENDFSIKSRIIETTIRYIADKNDRVVLTINSPGGNIVDNIGLLNAVIFSDIDVVAFVPHDAHSLAAILSMMCREKYVSNTANFTFHRARDNNNPNVTIFAAPDTDLVSDLLDDYTRQFVFPFLTEQEKATYWANGDVKLTGKDLRERHVTTEI